MDDQDNQIHAYKYYIQCTYVQCTNMHKHTHTTHTCAHARTHVRMHTPQHTHTNLLLSLVIGRESNCGALEVFTHQLVIYKLITHLAG